jgi:hypothetical protein
MYTQIQVLSFSTSGAAPGVEKALEEAFAPATLRITCYNASIRPGEDAMSAARHIAAIDEVIAPELAVQLPEATALARALAREIRHRREDEGLHAAMFFDVWLPRRTSWFRKYACPNVICDVRYWQAETHRSAVRLQALEGYRGAPATGQAALLTTGGRPWVVRCPLCGHMLWPKCIVDIYDDDDDA